MAEQRSPLARFFRKEAITLVFLVFVGLVLVPIAIFIVGSEIFGAYAGAGFADFYSDIHSNLRAGNWVAIFLVMSPYLVWQMLRLSFAIFRKLAVRQSGADSPPATTNTH